MSELNKFQDDAVNVYIMNPEDVTGGGGGGAVSLTAMTPTASNVASSATSVTLLASNANRKMAVITNESTAVLYVKLGAAASATSYTYKLGAGDAAEILPEQNYIYTGIIDGIWASANGAARVTEFV